MEKKQSRFLSNDYVEELFAKTGECWQSGSAVTLLFGCFTLYLFKWAAHERMARESAIIVLETFLGPIDGAIVYLLPLLFTFLTVIFGLRTFRSYRNTFLIVPSVKRVGWNLVNICLFIVSFSIRSDLDQ